MRIVAHIGQKIKEWLSDGKMLSEGLLALSVVLIALISFSLGRLSAGEEVRPVVPLPPEGRAGEEVSVEAGGEVVASKSGSAYHLPWCPGASQIAERNKVWFESAEAARTAGYAPAKNCKGLE